MNPFTKHPNQQGFTYVEHWCFAMGIACRLLHSVAAFVVHALFPFVSISPRLDLESTAAFIEQRNDFVESIADGRRAPRSLGRNRKTRTRRYFTDKDQMAVGFDNVVSGSTTRIRPLSSDLS